MQKFLLSMLEISFFSQFVMKKMLSAHGKSFYITPVCDRCLSGAEQVIYFLLKMKFQVNELCPNTLIYLVMA